MKGQSAGTVRRWPAVLCEAFDGYSVVLRLDRASVSAMDVGVLAQFFEKMHKNQLPKIPHAFPKQAKSVFISVASDAPHLLAGPRDSHRLRPAVQFRTTV
jgi:hypothetical protein